MIGIVLLWIFPVLLVAAAFTDLMSFTIPNVLTAAMLVLFPIFLLAMALSGHSLGWSEMSLHLLAGGVALVAGMLLFAIGGIGGGDAKLFAMACLWLGWNSIFQYAILSILLGGLLAMVLLFMRRYPLPPSLTNQAWLVRLTDAKAGVPYGIALAVAAMIVFPDTELFRLAAIV